MKTILYANFNDCNVNRRMLAGARRIATMRHWNLQTIPPCNAKDMSKIIDFWHPDGILYGASGDNEAPELRDFRSIPAVMLDALPPSGKTRGATYRICCDNEGATKAAARELFSPDISSYAFCGIRDHYAWTDIRANTFRNLVALHGGQFNSLWLSAGGSFNNQTREKLIALPKPCGILAANDEVAALLLGACATARIPVPREVSVASIDDDLLVCEHTNPTLTSVRLDLDSAGFKAAELLSKLLSGHPPSETTTYFGPLMTIRRASTRRKGFADTSVAEAIEFIRREIHRPLGINDVAAKMGCSRRMAQLRFSRSLGQTIGQVIQSIRLERAKHYLHQSEIPLGEIAQKCGYHDESALRRLFKSKTGYSMRNWRNENE